MEKKGAFESFNARVDGHRLTFAVRGGDRLALLIDAIDAAKSRLRLYFYIFAGGEAATQITDALIEARNRGVDVSLLVDGFGTDDQAASVYAPLIEAGVTFARFFPRFGRRYLLRNHQKILIVDERVAIIGGSNVEDNYFVGSPEHGCWHDLLLRIEGKAVARLIAYYDDLAAWMTGSPGGLRALNAILARHSDEKGALRWLFGGPSRRLNRLTRSLRTDIIKAKRLDMIQAYFSPNWGFLRKLRHVGRGGQLRLVTASKSDNQTTIAAARHCYRRLLRSGAEIYEFLPEPLHMKCVVADDAVYVGSANFDMRSLYLNTEIMLRIEDAALAERMRMFVTQHCDLSDRVTRESHRANSGWLSRLRWLIGYLTITALDYKVARSLNWKQD